MGRSGMTMDAAGVNNVAMLQQTIGSSDEVESPSEWDPLESCGEGEQPSSRRSTRRVSFAVGAAAAEDEKKHNDDDEVNGDDVDDIEIQMLKDEAGRTYFYNRMSGQTAWSREEVLGVAHGAMI